MISSIPPKVEAGALYNSNEASRLLGIHRNSLRRFVRQNFIHPKADMVTKRHLFEGRELTRFWYSRIS